MPRPSTNFPTLDDILAEIERADSWSGDNWSGDETSANQISTSEISTNQISANQLENFASNRVSSAIDMNDSLTPLNSDPVVGSSAAGGIPQLQRTDASADAAPGPGSDIWQNQLSGRQRALPRLDYRMLGGVVAIMLLVVGVGSATMLVSKPQDLRQQAYEVTLPTVSGDPATMTQAQLEAQLEQQRRAEQDQDDQERAGAAEGQQVGVGQQVGQRVGQPTPAAGESMIRTPAIWWAGALLAVALIGLVIFLAWLWVG